MIDRNEKVAFALARAEDKIRLAAVLQGWSAQGGGDEKAQEALTAIDDAMNELRAARRDIEGSLGGGS